ncbi:MAG: gamma-glutamyl-gamma-aminobutyrate hydrolase family protein, partial [Alphaproteobacteria bacterium]|nr:gamma-glutamyl-gamma-aminobutyrate hydrolase family protein [Alphaproteobacteria bacterium]
PVLEDPIAMDGILSIVDGVFLTGSPSNVAPDLYGGQKPREGVLQDRRRDNTTLPLIRHVIASGKPFLAVCRGFQEMNVAFGGTLHQHLEEIPGRFDHREDKSAPLDIQYASAHDIALAPGGFLERLAGKPAVRVNSLHGQGVDRLGEGLVVEATAPDGTIEAIRPADARAFALGVQWHPEWRFWEDAFSASIFGAFGDALGKQTNGVGVGR